MYKTEDLGSLSSGTRRICKQVSGNRRWALIWLTGIMLISQPSCSETGPTQRPPGQEESLKTDALETGAAILQIDAPLDPINVYLVGFHPMKENPEYQVEAHHFCNQVNADFMQCVLFDGNTSDANLNGVEYIISKRLFETLPGDEKAYWHPHNYEILSGQLVAPNIPSMAEMELMEGKMNSYGKTWHLWNTATGDQEGDELPLGEPMLACSFNRDGEVKPELVEHRDERMGIDSKELRQKRAELVQLAEPQSGVDALKDKFSGPTESIPGVQETPPP